MGMKAKRVLIADDDGALCRILEVRFRNLGVHAVSAHDAMHALVLAHRDPPDLILLDITMPAGNGLAVCEMLRTDRRLVEVPIIILTGRSDAATLERVRALGVPCVAKSGDLWRELRARACEVLDIAPAPTALAG